LFKLYILGYFFGIPSERRLFREVEVNLAYRWYLGYDLDEEMVQISEGSIFKVIQGDNKAM